MVIATPSFKVAVYANGDPNDERVAIVMPGFLDTKDHPHMRSHVDFLASKGFYALSFDPPGTWGSEGDSSLYTMTNWLKAIDEIISALASRPTFIMGTSRGGSVAMLASIRNPHIFAFAAVMSKASYAPEASTIHPVDEWKQAGFREFMVTIPGLPNQKQKFNIPYSVVEDTQRYNMLEALHTLTKPKLFIEGLQDVVVRPEVMRAAFEYSTNPKQLSSVDSDHMYRRRPEIIEEVNQIVGKFIDDFHLLPLRKR